MKKTYNKPTTMYVLMDSSDFMQASGELRGVGVGISNTESTSAGESRRSSSWEDDEE